MLHAEGHDDTKNLSKAEINALQTRAKNFLAVCLRGEPELVDAKVPVEEVRAKLAGIITPTHPLTSQMPNDIEDFCPGYAASGLEGRARFWQELLTAIVGPESRYKTMDSLWEWNSHQYSLGLLQLSYNDKKGYVRAGDPTCDFSSEAQVTNPDKNLQCGVRIMTRLISNEHYIGATVNKHNIGAARYWSTVSLTSSSRKEVMAATRALAVCQGHG